MSLVLLWKEPYAGRRSESLASGRAACPWLSDEPTVPENNLCFKSVLYTCGQTKASDYKRCFLSRTVLSLCRHSVHVCCGSELRDDLTWCLKDPYLGTFVYIQCRWDHFSNGSLWSCIPRRPLVLGHVICTECALCFVSSKMGRLGITLYQTSCKEEFGRQQCVALHHSMIDFFSVHFTS